MRLASPAATEFGVNDLPGYLLAEAADNAALGKTHAILDLGLVLRATWPRGKDADAVMRCHYSMAAIGLGVVEARAADARLQIAAADVVASIGNEEHQDAAKTNFRRLANDLRQLLLTFGIDSAIAKRREIEALGACTESRPGR